LLVPAELAAVHPLKNGRANINAKKQTKTKALFLLPAGPNWAVKRASDLITDTSLEWGFERTPVLVASVR
jgi:hypothetical protein